MAVILKALSESDVYGKYGATIDLLHWVLIRLRDPYIKSVQKECVSCIPTNCIKFSNIWM